MQNFILNNLPAPNLHARTNPPEHTGSSAELLKEAKSVINNLEIEILDELLKAIEIIKEQYEQQIKSNRELFEKNPKFEYTGSVENDVRLLDRQDIELVYLIEQIIFNGKYVRELRNSKGLLAIIITQIGTSLRQKSIYIKSEEVKGNNDNLFEERLLNHSALKSEEKIRNHFIKASTRYKDNDIESGNHELQIGFELLIRKLVSKFHISEFQGNPIRDEFKKILLFLQGLKWDKKSIIDPLIELLEISNNYKHGFNGKKNNGAIKSEPKYILEFILSWWDQRSNLNKK